MKGETMKHECDCGARYNTIDALYACQNASHYKLPATCSWVEDEGDIWFTGCGNVFTFADGGPSENGAKFCMYCGARLIATRYDQL